jgi:hypothetical protein
MTKKILLMITAICAALTLTASPVTVTADATYYTKFLDRGVVAYNDVAVVGVNVEVAGFVLGASTFNTIQANAVGKNIVSSGLLKRIDTTVGYKFTAPLANLTLGSVYSSYSKSISNIASTNEPFVKLDGKLWKNSVWDITGRSDLKLHTNNVETNVKLPFGFQHLKIVPSVGYGFNDPGAATIAALKNAKQYALVGVGVGYYTKYATLNVGVYQSRDTLFTAGNTNSGVSGGLAVKF